MEWRTSQRCDFSLGVANILVGSVVFDKCHMSYVNKGGVLRGILARIIHNETRLVRSSSGNYICATYLDKESMYTVPIYGYLSRLIPDCIQR
jgi:hypothetical protein